MKNDTRIVIERCMERREIVNRMIRILEQKKISPLRIVQDEFLTIYLYINIKDYRKFLKIQEEVYEKLEREIEIETFDVFLKNEEEYWQDENDTDVMHHFLDRDSFVDNYDCYNNMEILPRGIEYNNIGKNFGKHDEDSKDFSFSVQNRLIDLYKKQKSLSSFTEAFVDKIGDQHSILTNPRCIKQDMQWAAA